MVDGANYTVHLAPQRCKAITTRVTQVTHITFCPFHKFKRGQANSSMPLLPFLGGKGYFLQIHRTLRDIPPYITITPILKSTLLAWCTIIHQVSKPPSSVRLLIPQPPHFLQYTVACLLGYWWGYISRLFSPSTCCMAICMAPFCHGYHWNKNLHQ